MGHWSVEQFEQYLVDLFIAKEICRNIVDKALALDSSIKATEQLAIGIEKNGKNIQVILKVFDDSLPKCWVEGFQYKFNSYIAEIINIEHNPKS